MLNKLLIAVGMAHRNEPTYSTLYPGVVQSYARPWWQRAILWVVGGRA